MSLAYVISAYNRRRKWDLFLSEVQPTPAMRVLDVGYSASEHSNTDNFIEKHYPYPEQLTALGIDEPDDFGKRYPEVKVVQYDGVDFPFEDNCFDVCWSNAVIEHVGNHDRQLKFVKEIGRVAKRAFITTPNKYFPIEVHTRTPFLHYLPDSLFHRYLNLVGKSWAAGDYMELLSLADLKRLAREAELKDFRIVKNRLLGFTVDFVIMFEGRG